MIARDLSKGTHKLIFVRFLRKKKKLMVAYATTRRDRLVQKKERGLCSYVQNS